MNNTVIKVLNKEHGKEVISFFKDKGVDTLGMKGMVTAQDNLAHIYYGVIAGKFNNWTLYEVKVHDCEIIELPKELEFPRRMLIWNNIGDTKYDRLVLCKLNIGKPDRPYIFVHKDEESKLKSGKEYLTFQSKYAEEIKPITEEMTLEQVCRELGRDIKIVK